MLPVSDAELVSLRAELAATLDKTAVLYPVVVTKDVYGTDVTSWPHAGPTVACGMAEPSAGQLANYAYVIGSLAAWKLKFPYGTAVNHQDHVLLDGQTLEVQVDLTEHSYAGLVTVLASEVK